MIAVNRANPLAKQSRRFVLTKVGECLYRSPTGNYYAVVKASGRQHRKNLETNDKVLARQKLAEFRNELCRPDPPPEELAASIGDGTFSGLAEHWLEFIKVGLKPKSHLRRVLAIKLLKPHFGDKPLRKITRMDCERWSIARSQQVAARSFNIEVETLSLLLRYAVSHGLLADNPSSTLKRRRVVKSPIMILTKDQFKMLIERMRTNSGKRDAQQSADLVEFLAYTGCRIAEARAVLWKHIDYKRKTLTITGGAGGTKNGEIRTIPLFPSLESFLMRYRTSLGKEPDENDRVIPIHEAKTAIRNACETLKLPKVLHHSCRHFFCSNAIEAGVDFKTIAAWLGHKDGGVLVATTYGHLRAEHSDAMAKRMVFDAGASVG